MIEYHGWATIRESFSEEGESDILLASIWKNLHDKVSEINETNSNILIELRVFNGEYRLIISGSSNHKTSPWFEVLELFNWLASNAVGSYGLLHLYDDEDKEGYSNQFQVYVLKKGTVFHEINMFLSPYTPEIEV